MFRVHVIIQFYCLSDFGTYRFPEVALRVGHDLMRSMRFVGPKLGCNDVSRGLRMDVFNARGRTSTVRAWCDVGRAWLPVHGSVMAMDGAFSMPAVAMSYQCTLHGYGLVLSALPRGRA